MFNKSIDIRDVIINGLLAGLISLSLSVIGLIALLSEREIISGLFTTGHIFLVGAPFAMAYVTAGKVLSEEKSKALGYGLLIGVVASVFIVVLTTLATFFDIRRFLVNVTPVLIEFLTFGKSLLIGNILIVVMMGVIGLVGAGLRILPEQFKHPLTSGLGWTIILGMFSEILASRIRAFFGRGVHKLIFTGKAFNVVSATILLVLIVGFTYWNDLRKKDQPEKEEVNDQTDGTKKRLQRIKMGVFGVLLLIAPLLLGTYLTEVTNNVGLYILMGLGLNIVVGFAGLLDLGYVGFFAVGAYVMGVLTSEGALGLGFTFWTALPVAVLASTLAGVILGIPVLGMRGDYLAIVTMGFGEIIRILALSDLLKPYIGGAQGVLQIPKPELFGLTLLHPRHIYYIILVGVLIAVYVSWRLRDSRLGRQWMALREDEDVAEAMGINLVSTKLLAFGIGAFFGGLSGAIFASKLSSIFPHSFNLVVSINVLSLIIVGGLGSLPGVIVGALILVGLPELLREFAEHRMLMYGILLIVMMLSKPEGFIPSKVLQRELHAHEEPEPVSSD
ncbi:MAG: High-affinity branched-chain amino acid transport system permease protein LivH [Chloroflexi bacterium]|nr:High-affinity branched-chain amino acid transport system permease protein LivH [Chloroflexota bacterium]